MPYYCRLITQFWRVYKLSLRIIAISVIRKILFILSLIFKYDHLYKNVARVYIYLCFPCTSFSQFCQMLTSSGENTVAWSSLCAFHGCDKTRSPEAPGEEKSVSYTFPSQSIMKGKQPQESGNRNRSKGHGGTLLAGLFLITYSSCWHTVQDHLTRGDTAQSGLDPPTSLSTNSVCHCLA